ncbi:polysaccharide deacetylase family protein [Peribacillus sp. FSL H8-0477]|uniref:polysaccharide deacetylase family protein n=1 Tax=Peribacillus sp. FSL H8-0477 TaxID=2921388 RepID=UPI0030F6DD8D
MRKLIGIFLILSWALIACSNQEIGVKSSSEPLPEKETATKEGPLEREVEDKEVKEELKKENSGSADQKQYVLNPNNWSVKPKSSANPKVVLLTFDDSPDKYALDIAKQLQELNVKAIFFVNGHFIDNDKQKKILRQIHEMGFSIGNHTYNHVKLTDLSEEEQRNEIVKVNDVVEELTGARPQFFRAPYGANTEFSKQLAKEEGMLLMNWSFGYDWQKEYQEKEKLTEIMLDTPYLMNGANLLMHDRKWTSEAITDIVKGYQKKGFEILDPSLLDVSPSK